MKYWVTLNGNEHEVTVEGDVVRLDGESLELTLVSDPASPMVTVRIQGTQRRLGLLRRDDDIEVYYRGRRLRARVEDPRARALREVTGRKGGASSGMLKAPMPGLVLRLMVEPGSLVEQGSPVLVLEAMKMENEIKAPAQGRVSAVRVSAGQAVEKGTLLVEIDPETA